MAAVAALGLAGTASAKILTLAPLTADDPLSKSVIAPAGSVVDYATFTIANASLDVYAQLVNGYTQNSKHQLATGLLSSGAPQSYIELFSGTPTGAHAAIAGSWSELTFNPTTSTVTATTDTFDLSPGAYFLEIVGLAPGKSGAPKLATGGANYTVGIFGSAVVPEPATWAMMILGVGMIGLAARRRHAGRALAA